MIERVCRAGDRAVLIDVADSDEALSVAAAARSLLAEQLEDVVVGHRTVLVSWPEGRSAPCSDWTSLWRGPEQADSPAPATVTIDVRYDGEDLAEVASLVGMSVEEVVGRHRSAAYRVGFVGFSPGFAYLVGGDAALAVPRLAQPRPRVPAGRIAIAGPYTSVYPTSSPGGWRLIGATSATIFDPLRDPPALLEPGMSVRLRDVTAS